MYQQAELEQRVENGVRVMTSWIPQTLAIPGLTIRLKGHDGEWTGPWEVTGVGNKIIGQKDAEIMYKTHKAFERVVNG